MLLVQFILQFSLAYAATCSARNRQGGSASKKAAVQQQGGQTGGQLDGVSQLRPVPVVGSSGGTTGSTGDQQTTDQLTGQTPGETSEQQNVSSSGPQNGQESTGQTDQGATGQADQVNTDQSAPGSANNADQQVDGSSNKLAQVDGGPSTSSTPDVPAPSSSSTPGSTGGADATGEKLASPSTSGGMKASFTSYGAGDSFGSGSCNTPTAACGWYSNPGYNAAVSQALFGVGPGGGAGPACGQCFRLSPVGEGTSSIVVKVNNLCPSDGNPLCSAPIDVNVNFDLCKDDGAAAALFGGSSVGQVNGTYAPVSCSEWSGSGNLT